MSCSATLSLEGGLRATADAHCHLPDTPYSFYRSKQPFAVAQATALNGKDRARA
jgi:hypothetical protein